MHKPLCVFILLGCLAGRLEAGCEARSGSQTAVLVELYTSESCRSCPPADRWLTSLAGRPGVVPLALHVDYRDYIDSKPVKRRFTQLQRLALGYTPQVLLQGREFRGGWGTPAFEQAVARISAQPARAHLVLRAQRAGNDALEVSVQASLSSPGATAAVYLTAYQKRVASGGHVALEWQGPIQLGSAGKLEAHRRLPLLPGAAVHNSGVVGFVQDRGSGEILQALMLPACFQWEIPGDRPL